MGHDRDRLEDDFPGKADRIESLKAADPHFTSLLEKYHDLTSGIHRLEAVPNPDLGDAVEELKRRRLKVKDEIAALISAKK